jgi:hypothetical protein
LIHDARVYNRALSTTQVAELHGLVGHWQLSETSGTTATDASLLGNHGTYANGVTLNTSGPKPSLIAAQFDGVNDHVSLPTCRTDFSKGYSIAAWARFTSTASWSRLAELGNGADVDNFYLSRDSTNTNLVAGIHDGSLGAVQRLYGNGEITNNQWHHYAATVDSTGLATLYRDGVATDSGTIGVPPKVARTTNYIARSNWPADGYYQGKMWDVRLFNRPISPEEVVELYQGGYYAGVKIIKWVEIQ